jgi:hypothetical protein
MAGASLSARSAERRRSAAKAPLLRRTDAARIDGDGKALSLRYAEFLLSRKTPIALYSRTRRRVFRSFLPALTIVWRAEVLGRISLAIVLG